MDRFWTKMDIFLTKILISFVVITQIWRNQMMMMMKTLDFDRRRFNSRGLIKWGYGRAIKNGMGKAKKVDHLRYLKFPSPWFQRELIFAFRLRISSNDFSQFSSLFKESKSSKVFYEFCTLQIMAQKIMSSLSRWDQSASQKHV